MHSKFWNPALKPEHQMKQRGQSCLLLATISSSSAEWLTILRDRRPQSAVLQSAVNPVKLAELANRTHQPSYTDSFFDFPIH